jgi:hypothetical protein
LFGIGISLPYFFAAACMVVAFLIISAKKDTITTAMNKLRKNIDFKIAVAVTAALALVAGYLIFTTAEAPEISSEGERVLTKQESALLSGDTLYRDAGGEYSVMVPKGWFAHEKTIKGWTAGEEGDVSFTVQELAPQEGESVISDAYFSISKNNVTDTKNVTNPGEWLVANGFTDKNLDYKDGLITRQGSYEMLRFVMGNKKTKTDTLYYIFFPDAERVIVFSHAPYTRGGDTAVVFDRFVKSFENFRGQQ